MREYWATLPEDELASKLNDFVKTHCLQRHPMYPLWSRAYGAYYANAFNGDEASALNFLGREGEILQTSINEFRKVVRQGVSIITRDRLNFEPSTESTQADVLEQAENAKHLAAFWVSKHKLDEKKDLLAEAGRLFGTAFLGVMYRNDLGEDELADVDTGTIYRTGDLDFFTLLPWDVFYDWRKTTWDDVDSCVFRVRRNRYSLAALQSDPAVQEKILSGSSAYEEMQETGQNMAVTYNREFGDIGSETIFLYYFVHKPCPALPKGRMMSFLGSGEVINDSLENPYGNLIIEPYIPETFQSGDMVYGYPSCLDALPPQESLDTVFSALTTNLSNLAVQALQAPDAANIDVKTISGMSFFSVKKLTDGGLNKIEPLQLTQNPQDGYKFVDYCRNYVTELGDLNGVLRGTPPAGVDAGIALATLSANALEALQPAVKALVGVFERTMSNAVVIFSRFAADKETTIPVKGEDGKSTTRTLTGKKVEAVKMFTMKISNPLLLSLSGKISLTKELLATGAVKSGQEFIQLIETGSLPAVLDDSMDEVNLINRENEMLRKGAQPAALDGDTHNEHILSHRRIVADPELRLKANAYRENLGEMNPPDVRQAYQIVAACLAHIDEHLGLIQNGNPILQAVVQTGKLPMAGGK